MAASRRWRIAARILFFSLSIAVQPVSASTAQPASLTGRVLDPQGQGVPRATVIIDVLKNIRRQDDIELSGRQRQRARQKSHRHLISEPPPSELYCER